MKPAPHWRLALAGLLCSLLLGRLPLYPASVPGPLEIEMLSQVRQEALYAYTGTLSGEWPARLGIETVRIETRATNSGLPIQNATQYVFDHLQGWGLSPVFSDWTRYSYSGRNVSGSLPGSTSPSEIVLLTAHLDDAPLTTRAPGADDDASGSVGVLLAAEILSRYRFERTVRFVFFTGEEQGLSGSRQYALDAHARGENIVAVLNLDMIGWDVADGPVVRLHTRTTLSPGADQDIQIAQNFLDVVSTYSLALQPVIDADGTGSSDHASFWQQGYPAILAIEDNRNDFNVNYHSLGDNLFHLKMEYFTNIVKAAVGSIARLARPLGRVNASFQARLDPPSAMQWAEAGDSVTYSLLLTNTSTRSDAYSLSIEGNQWDVAFPASVGPLASGVSVPLEVTVTVPANTPGGQADLAALRVTSVGAGAVVDGVELTTMTRWELLYFPLVER